MAILGEHSLPEIVVAMPSYVTFTSDGPIVGEKAEFHASENQAETVFNMKRVLGKKHEELRFAPFKMTSDEDENVVIMDKFSPEYVLSVILKEMKQVADAKLNTDIKDAVMTVPSNFTDL